MCVEENDYQIIAACSTVEWKQIFKLFLKVFAITPGKIWAGYIFGIAFAIFEIHDNLFISWLFFLNSYVRQIIFLKLPFEIWGVNANERSFKKNRIENVSKWICLVICEARKKILMLVPNTFSSWPKFWPKKIMNEINV